MRPPGEIRAALVRVVQGGGHYTWRDLAAQAGVGLDAARMAVENMVRAGDLVPVGTRALPHSRRPLAVYAHRTAPAACPDAAQPLAHALRAWVNNY